MSRIGVLIVDDSAVVRDVLCGIFESAAGIEVIGAAADPIFAQRYLDKKWPDVIILDIEMPRMDGLTFLSNIMRQRPTPVVICSSLVDAGAEITMKALEQGAVEIITKPKMGVKGYLSEQKSALLDVVRAAANANLAKWTRIARSNESKTVPATAPVKAGNRPAPSGQPPQKNTADVVLAPPGKSAMVATTEKVVAIGTSTGGTQALEVVLKGLTRLSPGVVIVQHMPEQFTKAFANRLNSICEIEVKEAEDGDRVITGRALIAPGGRHMMLQRSGARYFVEVVDGPLVSRHKPSVDVLFRSVAKTAGKNALGIIMTGMGDDGANGLAEMHQAGAETLAQNEASCVVFGMPQEAIKRGAVDCVLSLEEFSAQIMKRSAY